MNASESKRRWFYPQPAWLIVLSLATTGFLFLSERGKWFAFNQHKGWTVLIAVASAAVVLAVMLLWWLAALVFRWRFQFSIRSLLVLVLAIALPCSWLTVEIRKAREQRDVLLAVMQEGAFTMYGPLESPSYPDTSIQSDFFHNVAVVGVDSDILLPDILENAQHFGDERLASLVRIVARLQGVQVLDLHNTIVSDNGLPCLERLAHLRNLSLANTNVTDEGVKKLQQALPYCKIERSQ
jgi:hypothetical protein